MTFPFSFSPIFRLLFVSAALAFCSCKQPGPQGDSAASPPGPGGPGAAMPPTPVTFVYSAKQNVPVEYEFSGVTQPSRIVEVRSRVQGFLDKRLFEEGAYIKEGQPLYEIDKRSFAADVEVAQAGLEQASATLTLRESEFRRAQKLAGSSTISREEFDQAKSQFDSARASVRLSMATLQKSRLELSYTEIHAPLSGIIGKTEKEVGSFVDSNTDSLLARITAVSPIYVSIRMSERDYVQWKSDTASGTVVLKLSEGPRFTLESQNGVIFPEDGKLNFEDPEFDTGTGTYEIRAEFPNKQRLLKPGQFVKVKMGGYERPGAVSVPKRAVTQAPGGAFLLVAGKNDTVENRIVELGPWTGPNWIIKSGLQEGERVIVEGVSKVRPGMKVAPVAMTSEDNAATSSTKGALLE